MGLFAAARLRSPGKPVHVTRAPLLPKLRGHCAEFLDHGSPDRLGMLYPPTCVGFGTGARGASPRGFSRGHGCGAFAPGASSRVSASREVCFTASRPTCFHGGVQNPARLPFPVTARIQTLRGRYGNVRPLRIGYAFRPRLSPRLTLGGLASPRKPWACGGGVSRAALATHASILAPRRSTWGRPHASPPRGRSPTAGRKPCRPAASAPCLAPCIVGALPLDQ